MYLKLNIPCVHTSDADFRARTPNPQYQFGKNLPDGDVTTENLYDDGDDDDAQVQLL